jgi:transcriptional regulator with XRE-family HTH domain
VGIHAFRPALRGSPIADPLERSIAEAFGRRIVALRLKHELSRLVVVERTGINWKRIRALEEGRAAPGLHEVVKLAAIYGTRRAALLRRVMQPDY